MDLTEAEKNRTNVYYTSVSAGTVCLTCRELAIQAACCGKAKAPCCAKEPCKERAEKFARSTGGL